MSSIAGLTNLCLERRRAGREEEPKDEDENEERFANGRLIRGVVL
jgi:hypothetical protein